METEEIIICRLCLKTCESFKVIEENIKHVLDKFLPKIDLTGIQEPVSCTNCADMLMKYFDFKAACLCTRDYIISFVNNKNAYKLDLRDVYLIKNENGDGIPKDQVICVFCISSVNNYSAISLVTENGDIILKKMIEQCLPELDLGIIKNPVICTPCHGSLEKYFCFVTNCLIVEEKIKKYRESLDLNSAGQIKLSSLLQCTIRNALSEDGNAADKVKVEEQFCTERVNADEEGLGSGYDVFKLEQMFCDDSENAENEVESKTSVGMDDMKFDTEEQFISKNKVVCKEGSNNLDLQVTKMEEMFCGEIELKEEYFDEAEDQKYLTNKEIELKIDDVDSDRLEVDVVLPLPEGTNRLCRKQKCLLPNLEWDLPTPCIKQTLTNKKSSVIEAYQCELCSFQTKYERSLKRHLLKHENPSNVTMYKCDSCPFQTKYRNDLKRHLLRHKDSSETMMYKCDSCLYLTKYKSHLKCHLLKHKDPSEVTMYKCDSCLYITKYKGHLKHHLLNHKDPSEVRMYKCDSCLYQTKYKGNLNAHLLKHKDPSEVTMYKCDFCTFQTKFKANLKTHLSVHKSLIEVTLYRCYSCSYYTKYKESLARHVLKHC